MDELIDSVFSLCPVVTLSCVGRNFIIGNIINMGIKYQQHFRVLLTPKVVYQRFVYFSHPTLKSSNVYNSVMSCLKNGRRFKFTSSELFRPVILNFTEYCCKFHLFYSSSILVNGSGTGRPIFQFTHPSFECS